MALSDTRIRTAKPGPKGYRLTDSGGLHLWVTPTGAKIWRLRHAVAGREQTAVLGRYPAMGLADARLAALAFKGGPPAPPSAPTLRAVTAEWHGVNLPRWKPHHAAEVLGDLTREILDSAMPGEAGLLGNRPIDAVTAPMLLTALRALELRGAIDTAHRLRARLDRIFAFAIAAGHCHTNPAAAIRAALAPHVGKGHRAAVTTLEAARETLRAAEAIPAQPTTRLALRFLALTAARPGEIGGMQWSELEDLAGPAPLWRIPAARMKATRDRAADVRDHEIPLAPAAVAALAAVRPLTGRAPFVFPSAWSARQPMSANALSTLLRRAGLAGVQVPHGWRATFSTVMNERYPADRAVIDLMLAHTPKDAVEAAYNRARHMERRRQLAALWADLLLEGALPLTDLLALRRR